MTLQRWARSNGDGAQMYSFQGTFLIILFDSSFSISSRVEFSTSAQAGPVFEF